MNSFHDVSIVLCPNLLKLLKRKSEAIKPCEASKSSIENYKIVRSKLLNSLKLLEQLIYGTLENYCTFKNCCNLITASTTMTLKSTLFSTHIPKATNKNNI